ncbi:hypothetical protein OPKNFCMD_2660 [Methylobacterium crusticola]|uniref:Lysine transporter LysE n=1 Tax=Methylobacterium crusticola TaxID=1697972 RepID=A0ABQ4QZ29_9HYPH|nr:LysE family transporter [Methylobacterium crusticola]GJD49924.1 hypothetical protein OPKNFCMD_2660 [Methylobacterium crusticola]
MLDAEPFPRFLATLLSSYALVLAVPGPNWLVVLRASLVTPGRGPACAALGIACGAALAAAFAAGCASLLPTSRLVTGLGTALFAALLVRAALRLLSGRAQAAVDAHRLSPGRDSATFGLGLLAAVSNPVSLAYFAGFFLAHPRPEGQGALPVVGAAVFVMAATWFGLLGLLFTHPACRHLFARAGRWMHYGIAAGLVACAALAVWRAVGA